MFKGTIFFESYSPVVFAFFFSFKNIPNADWDQKTSFDWNPCTAFNKKGGCGDALVSMISSLFGNLLEQLFELQWNLSFGAPLIKGQLYSGDTKFGPGKMFT